MFLFNYFMGLIGLTLAGISPGKGIRDGNRNSLALGVVELIVGLYFIIAAIGVSSSG